MKLNKIKHFPDDYTCELTLELDKLSGLDKKEYYDFMHHYILADDWCLIQKCLAIRVPGGTVGGIIIDADNKIVSIEIDRNYVVRTYPENLDEIMQKYIGVVVEW